MHTLYIYIIIQYNVHIRSTNSQSDSYYNITMHTAETDVWTELILVFIIIIAKLLNPNISPTNYMYSKYFIH